MDNAGRSIFAGAIALAVGGEEIERTALRRLPGGTPLARIVFRAISPGDARLGLADLATNAPGAAEYDTHATVSALAVTEGACADPLPTTTPYVRPPTVTPVPAPRTEPRAELPAGLPPPPPGCEWVVSNPEPPQLVILRFCGTEQTQWLFDTRTGELTQARVAGGSPPIIRECALADPPSCPAPSVQSPPEPAPGCKWLFANLEEDWIEGDPRPQPSPWNSFVDVCDGYMTGRVFYPLTGVMGFVEPRRDRISERSEN